MNVLAFHPGAWEIGVFVFVLLLLFGTRLPKIARSMGQAFGELRRGLGEASEAAEEIAKPPKKE